MQRCDHAGAHWFSHPICPLHGPRAIAKDFKDGAQTWVCVIPTLDDTPCCFDCDPTAIVDPIVDVPGSDSDIEEEMNTFARFLESSIQQRRFECCSLAATLCKSNSTGSNIQTHSHTTDPLNTVKNSPPQGARRHGRRHSDQRTVLTSKFLPYDFPQVVLVQGGCFFHFSEPNRPPISSKEIWLIFPAIDPIAVVQPNLVLNPKFVSTPFVSDSPIPAAQLPLIEKVESPIKIPTEPSPNKPTIVLSERILAHYEPTCVWLTRHPKNKSLESKSTRCRIYVRITLKCFEI